MKESLVGLQENREKVINNILLLFKRLKYLFLGSQLIVVKLILDYSSNK